MRTDPALAELLITRALKGGATMAEVWQRASRTIKADAKDSVAEAIDLSSYFGYSLRLIKSGRLGFSYSNSKDNPEQVVDAALSMTDITEPDEFLSLPESSTEDNGPEIMDTSVAEISEQDAIKAACTIELSARNLDSRIKKLRKASSSFSSSDTLIMNSAGVSQQYVSSVCSGSITVIAEENGDSQMGWGYETGRFLEDVSFDRIGREAAQRALWMLDGRRMQAVKAPVFMDSLVVVEFLSVFASMLSSESVQKGKSLLTGKTGEKVLSELIDITDDGLLARGSGSRPVDDEGVASQITPLIKQGVLQGFIYNTRTAKFDGVRSTGNAFRGGISSVPGVSITNLVLSSAASKRSSEEILKDIPRGLYVVEVMGMHMANPVSGHFSVGVSGLWIEKGEFAYPVKETVISGNLLDLFKNIEAVGSDIRFYGNIGAPGILFGDIDISA